MMWQRATFLCGFFLTASCAETQITGSVPLDGAGREVRRSIALTNLPQDQLRGELIASGQTGTFFRNAQNKGHITWRAVDGSALVTREGLLTSTFGLGFDLLTADVSDILALIEAGQSGTATRVHRYLDGEDQVVTRAFFCDLSSEDGAGGFRRMREVCSGADITFENDYVLGADGRIVTSRQWVGPDIGLMRLSRTSSGETGTFVVVAGR